MRVLCVPNELPLPANSGGRIDVWRRMQLLKGLGAQLALLTWFDLPRDGAPSPAAMVAINEVCAQVHLTPITRSAGELLHRFAWFGRLPSHAASRWVTLDQTRVLAWARAFAPDVLLLDGLYGLAAARWLSAALGVPWVYRAHNIEHLYMQRQWQSATRWRARLGITANLVGLQRSETAVVRDAARVFDISQSDMAHWLSVGGGQLSWLPPVIDKGFADAMAEERGRPAKHDVVYFGNLNTPNNVAAIRWLVQQIMPRLGARKFRLTLAGSRPNDEVQQLIADDARISLLADPPSMPEVAGSARVLVNPMLSGSGVNLKSIEMLFSHARLISTPAGVQGLPPEAVGCFEVQADADGFGHALAMALDAPQLPATALAARAIARASFAPTAAAQALQHGLAQVLPAVSW